MRIDGLSKSVIRFLKNHFDNTTLIALGAVFFIGWAKYNLERYACIDGNCLEVVDGDYASRAECHRNCEAVDSESLKSKKLMSNGCQNYDFSTLCGNELSIGNVWHSIAL